MPMRPPSSVAIATVKPRFSSWSSRSRPTNAPSKRMSAVEDEFSPSFSSSRVTSTSSASRRNRRSPTRLRRSRVGAREDEERAGVAAVRDPLLRAVDPPAVAVRRRRTSGATRRPTRTPASVSANAPSTLAGRQVAGRTAAAAPRVPNATIGSVAALVCTATVTPTPASARDSSSSTRMYERKSAPAPPSSSGTHTPIRPSSPSFAKSSRGKV